MHATLRPPGAAPVALCVAVTRISCCREHTLTLYQTCEIKYHIALVCLRPVVSVSRLCKTVLGVRDSNPHVEIRNKAKKWRFLDTLTEFMSHNPSTGGNASKRSHLPEDGNTGTDSVHASPLPASHYCQPVSQRCVRQCQWLKLL